MSLENYEPVAIRLDRWLKATYDAGKQPRVVTDLVHYGQEIAVFRAELYVDDTLIATGWAEEVRGQGNVNRTSHVENCESSAVGRALANAGLAGSNPANRPSREEMSKVQHPSNGGPRPTTTSTDPASPAQLGKIRAMSKALGKLPPHGMDNLTKRDASAVIEQLVAEQQAQDGATVQHQFRDAQEEPF